MAAGSFGDIDATAKALNATKLLQHGNAGIMEQHVEFYIATGSYDRRINRALIKLYQMYPVMAKGATVTNILLKSLMAMAPDAATGQMASVPEFPLVLHLLNPKMLRQANVQLLLELEGHLTAARFDRFWKALSAEDSQKLIENVHGFVDAMRSYIAFALSRTYTTLPVDEAKAALNIDDVSAACKQFGWEMDGSSGAIKIPANEGNSPSARRREDGVKVSDALAAMSATSSVL